MNPIKSRPAAFLALVVLAASFSVLGAAGPAGAQTCGPGQVPNPLDPYGCINATTTTATPPGALVPDCIVSDPSPPVGATVNITVTNVPIGITVRLLLDGQEVDSAVSGGGPQALGAAPAGGAKSARSAAAPKASAQTGVANVSFTFVVPALSPGVHSLITVGPGFVCECNPFAVERGVEGTGTSRGGNLARTGFTVFGLLLLAAVLVLVGRAMVESSRRRNPTA